MDGFAQLRVRAAGHARTQHSRMLVQHGGDFLREDLVSGDVNYGRGAAIEHNPPRDVAVREVAAHEPTLAQHFVTPPRRAQVAIEHAGSAQGELPGFADGHRPHRVVQNSRLKTRQGSADGLGMLSRLRDIHYRQPDFNDAIALSHRHAIPRKEVPRRLGIETTGDRHDALQGGRQGTSRSLAG